MAVREIGHRPRCFVSGAYKVRPARELPWGRDVERMPLRESKDGKSTSARIADRSEAVAGRAGRKEEAKERGARGRLVGNMDVDRIHMLVCVRVVLRKWR